jgi:UDP-N-acetylglucosamine 2-epimerase
MGTRPEAIKLCPVLLHLRSRREFQVKCCVTAQHRTMLDQVLDTFGVEPDYDLDLMQPGQSLAEKGSGRSDARRSAASGFGPGRHYDHLLRGTFGFL